MRLFDSHCHLDDRSFSSDLDAVLQRAAAAQVKRMLVVGVDRRTSDRALKLARRHHNLFASVGVHPHDAGSCSHAKLDRLIQLASDPNVVAWGETGLDFNRMYSPRQSQERWFIHQLAIADSLGLPLIFHERDSRGRLLEILRAHPDDKRCAVVHCFSGSPSELAQYLEMGFYIGITGMVTVNVRGQALRGMLKEIPKNRILVETDAPYLTPTPQRNKHRRNEPAFVRQVLLKVADVLGEDPRILAEQLWNNTCRLFRLDPLAG